MWQFHLLMPNAVGSENGKNVWGWAGHLIICVEFLVCNYNRKMDFHFHDHSCFHDFLEISLHHYMNIDQPMLVAAARND